MAPFLWGVASGVVAFATGFGSIFAARVLLGVAEAPAFPANSKATGYRFPRGERARATAIFDAAAKFSNVIGVPLVAVAVVTFGWRWGFGLTAILSFVYFLAYWFIYRDPSADPRLSREERDYIRKGGATPEGESEASPIGMLGYLLRNRKVWGLTIGFAAYGYSFYLFLTWLPGYLVSEMHMSIIKSAGYAAIPWLFATISDLVVGGWLIDHLLAKGYDDTKTRKAVLVGGMVLGLAVFGATMTTSPVWAIVWITIALSGLAAAAPVGWSIPSLIAPRGGTGTIGGVMNFFNNLMGAIAPAVTGFVVGATNSFSLAFLVAGIVLLDRHLLLRRGARPDRADPRAGRGARPLSRQRERPMNDAKNGTALVVMGVSGSGKTTVAELLAKQLGWPFMEGDRLHPPANVEKMRQGIPLTDADRGPWLDRIGEELKSWAAEGQSGVLTCSALKRAYRDRIRSARPDVRFVYLKGSEALIAAASPHAITNICRPRCSAASSTRWRSRRRTSQGRDRRRGRIRR